MSIRTALLASLAFLLPASVWAQTTPVEGLRENPSGVHALTGARIVVAPGRVIERGTLVIRNGVIEAVGANVAAPPDARVWDGSGLTLYPGFIDPYSAVGMRGELSRDDPERERGALYWNPQVRSHIDAVTELGPDEARLGRLRSQGFAVAMAVPQLGLFRGQTAVVSLGDESMALRVVRRGVAQSVTMGRDNQVGTGYPTSAMGGIAFIRQTLHDADWHMKSHAAYERNPRGVRRPEANAALAALAPALRKEQPLLFETRSEEEALRALRFREEFPVNLWIRGSGFEYRLADRFRGLDVPLILPVNFPEAPNVSSPERALNVSLGDLRHWHLAPENPKRLADARVEFAFTADGLGPRTSFVGNVRTAVERGLSRDVALAAMTTVPARYLGIDRTHGTLEQGKVANVVVAEGDLFADGSSIQAVFVDGKRFDAAAPAGVDPRGQWRIVAVGPARVQGTLTLAGTRAQLTGTFGAPGAEAKLSSARISGEAAQLQVAFPGDVLGHEGTVRLSASATASALSGWGELPDGTRFNWSGERIGDAPGATSGGASANGANGLDSEIGSRAARAAAIELPDVRPSMEYGRAGIPEQPANLLVRNATVWTMGPQGRLESADLLVTRGRVARVGQNLQAPAGAVVIDGSGKHVTPGLIDAHLHDGASGGINETGSAIVPEVRLGDVLTINNIWMYRHLAGGLTLAHVMHGSANPIGGQNQHVKMRWGALPEELKVEGAPRTVKFALGENVKRREDRYPDTRMGTEQIIRDHFLAAREYERRWQEWQRTPQGVPPRRDLRLQALVDILNGDILVQSHSYRQDEILMLMRLAEEFGFRIKAFHHTVEAYKVAPELAAHGAGAVVWTDWSSFKIEAYDGTTWNARVLRDAGVLTSLHSDNSQISSRMNWEAAKMLRTGLTPEEALALVTINTAKILGIDQRVGSLEAGKDADFVLWSGDPLSTSSKAEQTWVDGRRYFDLEEDRQLRERAERERAQLIQLILSQR
ncbi:MAG TPA: amidohydrolase family protein [Gemmatimonadaceae bacterium]|nr:amidohydrolase family protein [Gemmatimonadaceae bacterium]